jgi:UDP:flavonoid glycosyltransferase YjiC (YdhE family)
MQMSDLVIHCGGDGTTYQCLKNGLPAIVIPFNNDQRIKAHLIRHNRVGVALSVDRLSPARLLAVTRTLLEDTAARRQARSLQRQLQQADGPGTAAASILAFLQQNRFDAHAGVFTAQPEAVFSG